ncbi:4'-phosphopantetheinyl transferase family protein [Motilimonas sp. KMU-193]|uniref:4'-phosphopantetheinyl transferase family protein n=1 Tax=Motilimonas sp. KMU-193 TaxID=3388668 RepID=UPI00396B17C0
MSLQNFNACEVELHWVRLGHAPIPLTQACRELTLTQQQQAARLRGLAQLRYIKQRQVLNRALRQKSHLPILEFSTTANGKPVLLGCDLQFNLSHCGDYLLLAITSGAQVGVDLCLHKHSQTKIERLWQGCFGQPDINPTRREFYARWAMLEAWLKATGQGWHTSPQTINMLPKQFPLSQPIKLTLGYVGQILPLPNEYSVTKNPLPLTAAICCSQTIDKISYYTYQLA